MSTPQMTIPVPIFNEKTGESRRHAVTGRKRGAFLIHRAIATGGWAVTHIATGHLIVSMGDELAALRAADLFAEIRLDWDICDKTLFLQQSPTALEVLRCVLAQLTRDEQFTNWSCVP